MGVKKEIRLQVYNKYGGHCAYCGKAIEYKDMQVDHIEPRYNAIYRHKPLDELNVIDNYNPSCRACNFRKGTLSIEGFRTEIAYQAEAEMKRFQARMSQAYGLIEYRPEREVKFYSENHKENV